MLNAKEYFNQIEMDTIQQEPLFTELTPVEAAVVEGGKGFSGVVNFDNLQDTIEFSGVKSGGIVELSSNTFNVGGGRNPKFYATLKNITTGKSFQKEVNVGKDTTKWTDLRGGKDRYKIQFTDALDGIRVAGSIGVYYS